MGTGSDKGQFERRATQLKSSANKHAMTVSINKDKGSIGQSELCVFEGGQRAVPAGEVLRTSKEKRQRESKRLAMGTDGSRRVCARRKGRQSCRSAHEQVWWSGGGLGCGLGAGWTASDAVPTSWTQYLQRPRGEGKGPVGMRK